MQLNRADSESECFIRMLRVISDADIHTHTALSNHPCSLENPTHCPVCLQVFISFSVRPPFQLMTLIASLV